MHWSSHGFQSKIVGAAFFLTAVATWLLLRGYHGLLGDAQLYAFQALARIHPPLAHDLYLQNTSQDQFTIFSPAYAWFIELLGVESATRSLTLFFTIWFLTATWVVARTLTNRDGAWLAVIFLLIVDGSYGGSCVFRLAEQFLTARLPAEALIATSLACFLRGSKVLAAVTAAAALLIHPLIALPGLLLLMCLGVPIRVSLLGAAASAIAVLLIAFCAAFLPWMAKLFPIMDPTWLSIVQERSQFLFLRLWSFRDWEINARPFFYLAFIAFATPDNRVRKICVTAVIVGASGLAVALIADAVGPVAILVQGQAWRWVWTAVFVSALLLPATLLQIWPDKKCGPLCALLLLLGLTLPAANGTAFVSLSMILWLMRPRFSDRAVRVLRWISLGLLLAIAAWVFIHAWEIASSAFHKPKAMAAVQLRDFFELKIPAVLGASLIWWGLRKCTGARAPTLLCFGLLALSIFVLPAAFKQYRSLASAADISEASDWASVIPPTSTVLIAPARDVGTFVWFTLQRPNYLAVDQSAGVVFSRATALEVQRRSQVLLPVVDPNWKIRSELRFAAASGKHQIGASSRPLTAANLSQICADTQLGFVISSQHIGFDALTHKDTGSWMGWDLYDCRKVRTWSTAQ
ncbi:MAG: hypothetical protein ABI145_05005 [Steroidobacteraceae bacterium]